MHARRRRISPRLLLNQEMAKLIVAESANGATDLEGDILLAHIGFPLGGGGGGACGLYPANRRDLSTL